MQEVVGAIPQSTGPSIGGALTSNIGLMMLERGTTVHRTLRHGPIANKDIFTTLAGFRQTEEEMQRFLNPTYGGWNWRSAAWNNSLVEKGLGRRALLGTHMAPSSWLMSADLVRDPSLGSHALLNLVEGKDLGAWRGVRDKAGRFVKKNGRTAWDVKLNRSEANAVINGMLRMGTGTSTTANPLLDAAYASWFKVSDTAYEAAARSGVSYLEGKGAIYGGSRLGAALRGGRALRAAGADHIAGLTKFATVAKPLVGAAGVAIKAYNWGTLAYYGTKAAYKGWELYNIKAPMAAYKAVGQQLTRPAFSSGDASLLTGIPANNRMRALQAIQGSRLNARASLGNEASLLAGHFG